MLYIVATPIGNMAEMTFRAVEVLKEVDVIAAEDTRHSGILLKHYGIQKKLISYQKFNEVASASEIINFLKEGKNVALISDAGMPLISDPGGILVPLLIENDLKYTVISGACACVNALVLSGMDTSSFCMAGFLPEKNIDRQKFIERFANLTTTLIFYSAPHDILKNLEFLYSHLGDRKVSVVREISKMFEEVIRFTLGNVPNFTVKGEFVIVVEGASVSAIGENLTVKEHVQIYLDEGLSKMDAVKKVAKDKGIPKSIIYNEYLLELGELKKT